MRSGACSLKSCLAYHLRCLGEHATDQTMTRMERLALVRARMAQIRHIRLELKCAK